MQSVNTTNPSITPTIAVGIKLPPLPMEDIDKLDQLLFYMKEHNTEPVNIYRVCKEKWGDNRLLYVFFAEHLRKNSLASVQYDHDGPEYAWKQIITPVGLAFDGFKREYARRHAIEKPKKEAPRNFWQPLRGLANMLLVNAAFLRLRRLL